MNTSTAASPAVVHHTMSDLLNIENIIKLIEQQAPNRQDLVIALRNCKNGKWTSNAYYQFVDSKNPNKIGSKWQFDENIVLEQENKGDIVNSDYVDPPSGMLTHPLFVGNK